MQINLKDVAEWVLFGIVKTEKELLERINGHWQYRKNKGFNDVNNAIRKGLKSGRGRTEWEIDFVALYLKDVFKKVG